MNKAGLLLLFTACASAQNQHDALQARDEALQVLKGFNPVTVLKGYTANPQETTLQPQEGSNALRAQGLNALNNNGAANEVYNDARSRTKIPSNPNSVEMQYAERLLENSESADLGDIGCGEGQCDTSINEASDDLAEGLSRLGALAGVAGDVTTHQVRPGMPFIFIGQAKECKKYPLGFRDCCTDSGWGDWVKHCPQDLQALQRAKQENRVVYLGSYKNHKLGSHHHSYCIFPTKLAAIVQIQGRGGQLRIPYGTAEYPNCRGLTPEELGRINFSALDLSLIQQELIERMALPNNGSINNANQSHIEHLEQQGRAHD